MPEASDSHTRDRSLLERLAAGEIDDTEDFLTRLDILHLLASREASGLGSFLGGRIRLSRIGTVSRGARDGADAVRVACPPGGARQDHRGRDHHRPAGPTRRRSAAAWSSCAEALTVEWLGESAQVPSGRSRSSIGALADVRATSAPASTHRHAPPRVIALETLTERPERPDRQSRQASTCRSLTRPSVCGVRRATLVGGIRAVAPIAALGRHVCSSARRRSKTTPRFFRLLQLLRPEELPEGTVPRRGSRPASRCRPAPARRAAWIRGPAGAPPWRSSSAALRPGRVGDQPRESDWRHPIPSADGARPIACAGVGIGGGLEGGVGPTGPDPRQQAEAMDQADPRLQWPPTQAKALAAGEREDAACSWRIARR